jgi:hypothetical protein
MPDRTRGTAFGCMDAATTAAAYYPALSKFLVKNCLLLVPASMYLVDDE